MPGTLITYTLLGISRNLQTKIHPNLAILRRAIDFFSAALVAVESMQQKGMGWKKSTGYLRVEKLDKQVLYFNIQTKFNLLSDYS